LSYTRGLSPDGSRDAGTAGTGDDVVTVCLPMEVIDITAGGTGYRLLLDEWGQLRQVGFGPRVADRAFVPSAPIDAYPLAYPAFDEHAGVLSAIRVTHGSGGVSTLLAAEEVETAEGPGHRDTAIHLADRSAPLAVTLRFRAWEDDRVVEQWTEVTNRQDAPVRLVEVAAASPLLIAPDPWLTHFGGEWALEWLPTTERLTPGTKLLESRTALRPHLERSPYVLLSPDGPATEDRGLVLAGALGWVGNLRFAFDLGPDGKLRLWSGHLPEAGYELAPGASFTSPHAYWTWGEEGRGELSRRLHRFVRAHVVRDGHRPRATVLNSWEATSFDVRQERLEGLLDGGAALGAELFLLDDGWFGPDHPRDDDTAGLGDWRHDPRKLPAGLDPVIDRALERGLRFGLWIEPEMVSRASALFAAHPDWVLCQDGRHAREQRNQLVLDLLRPEVRTFVLEVIDALLADHPGISYLKWDANRSITEPGSPSLAGAQPNLSVDLVHALWGLMEEVARRYPDVEMMLCASGGGRVDLGTLRWFHEVWLSDNTDPVYRVGAQYAASHFLPANVVGAHVTRQGDRPLPFTCAVALSGRFGFDIDLAELSLEEAVVCRRAVELHEEVRDLVQQGDVWRLVSPLEPGSAAGAIAYVGPAATGRSVVFAYQLGDAAPASLPLPHLDPDVTYEVVVDDLSRPPETTTHRGAEAPWPLTDRVSAVVLRYAPGGGARA
jgi:alpha-galactosidase